MSLHRFHDLLQNGGHEWPLGSIYVVVEVTETSDRVFRLGNMSRIRPGNKSES